MAYDATKLTKLAALKALAERAKAESDKKLEGVKVNGTALTVADAMVDILIKTGTANGAISVNGTNVSVYGLAAMAYKANVSESDLASALKAAIDAKATKTELETAKEELTAKISSVYKPAGSLAFEDLPAPAEDLLGNVYNVTDAFTSTSNFLMGEGKTYPAGTNVVIVASDDAYKFDVLSGFVDLSGYVQKADGSSLMTSEEKTKLAGIEEGANRYTHPSYTARASGLYKVTVDATGHVSAAAAVAKADITALGIPSQDTTYSEATASAAGLMSAADKEKLDSIASGFTIATDDEVTEMLDEVFA